MPAGSRDNESASRWQSVVKSAVDGIIVIDAVGRIEAFNPAAERMFGYQEAEVVGQNVKLLMPSPYRDAHDEYIANHLHSRVPRIIGTGREVTAKRRDDSTFPIHLSVGEMVVGGEPKFTGIIHDLSARVRLEQQLREQPQARDKMFTPFFTTKPKGTGLGLATTKRLVEAHGGTIAIDSPPDGGAQVSIALPTVNPR